MALVLPPAEDNASHLTASTAPRRLSHLQTILAAVEPLDLPKVWLNTCILQLPYRLDHQQWAPLQIVTPAVLPHLVQLVWSGGYEQLEHVLAVMGVEIIG